MNISSYYKKHLIDDSQIKIKNHSYLRIDSIYNTKNKQSFQERMENLTLLKKNIFEIITEVNEDREFNFSKFNSIFEVLKNSIQIMRKEEKIEDFLIKTSQDESISYINQDDQVVPSKNIVINKEIYNNICFLYENDINLVLCFDIYSDYLFMYIFLLSFNLNRLRKHKDSSSYYDYFSSTSSIKEYLEEVVFIRKSILQFVSRNYIYDSFIEYNLKKLIDVFTYSVNVEFVYMYNIDYFLSFIKGEVLEYVEFWFVSIEIYKKKEKEINNEQYFNKERQSDVIDNITSNINTQTQIDSNVNVNFNVKNNKKQSIKSRIYKKTLCKVQILSNPPENKKGNQKRTSNSKQMTMENEKKPDISRISLSFETKSLYFSLLLDINNFYYIVKEYKKSDDLANQAIAFFKSTFFSLMNSSSIALNTDLKLFISEKTSNGLVNIANQYYKTKDFPKSTLTLKLFFEIIQSSNIYQVSIVSKAILLYSKILYDKGKFQESIDKLLVLTSDCSNEFNIKIDKKSVLFEDKALVLLWKSKNYLKINMLEHALVCIEEYIKSYKIIKNNPEFQCFKGLKVKFNILILMTKKSINEILNIDSTSTDDKTMTMTMTNDTKQAEVICQNPSWLKVIKNLNSIFLDFISNTNTLPFDFTITDNKTIPSSSNSKLFSEFHNVSNEKYENYKENSDLIKEFTDIIIYQLNLLLLILQNNPLLSSKIYKDIFSNKETFIYLSKSIISSSIVYEKLNFLVEAEEILVKSKKFTDFNRNNQEKDLENIVNCVIYYDIHVLYYYISIVDSLGSFYISTNQMIKGINEYNQIENLIKKLEIKGILQNSHVETVKNIRKMRFFNKWKYYEVFVLLNQNNIKENEQFSIISSLLNDEYFPFVDFIKRLEIIDKYCKLCADLNKFQECVDVLSKEAYFTVNNSSNSNFDCRFQGEIEESLLETIVTIGFYIKEKEKEQSRLSFKENPISNDLSLVYFEEIMLIGIRVSENLKLILKKIDLLIKIGLGFKAEDLYSKALYYFKQAESYIYSDASEIIKHTIGKEVEYETIKKRLIFNLGLIYMSLENFNNAEEYLKTAFQLFTDDPKRQGDCTSALGLCMENLGFISEAIGFYQSTLILRERVYGENSKIYQSVLNKVNLLMMS